MQRKKKHAPVSVKLLNLESSASILSPCQVFFLLMDDEASVPLGITAANARTSILMHLAYHVKLPDYDFMVGEKQTYSLC